MIPLSRPFIGDLEKRLVQQTLAIPQLTQSSMVYVFEAALAKFLDVEGVVAVCNGTAALHLALLAAGVKPGDRVIVPDLTYVATANAVFHCGATPVLADVDRETWTLDLANVERLMSRDVKAIVPVHLYGVAAKCVRELHSFGVPVVEDAAEGFGGSFGKNKIGSTGTAAAFSFYGNKIVTTGEGGAVASNDRDVLDVVRRLRGQAMDPNRRYFHTEVGYNYRMTEISGAIGVGQMKRVEATIGMRQMLFSAYRKLLAPHFDLQQPNGVQAPWLFTIRTKRRDELAEFLRESGIETRPGFVPLHRMPMFGELPDGGWPASSMLGDEIICLPTHPGMDIKTVEKICTLVVRWKETVNA